jgi:hypothetical protein
VQDEVARPARVGVRWLLGAGILAWLALHLWVLVPTLQSKAGYLRFAVGASSEEIRAFHTRFDPTSRDWYAVLKACDALLPPGDMLQIVLPEKPQARLEYLRDKARYLLYPRNTGDNATPRPWMLVYRVPDFEPPSGYRVVKRFAPHATLLAREDVQPAARSSAPQRREGLVLLRLALAIAVPVVVGGLALVGLFGASAWRSRGAEPSRSGSLLLFLSLSLGLGFGIVTLVLWLASWVGLAAPAPGVSILLLVGFGSLAAWRWRAASARRTGSVDVGEEAGPRATSGGAGRVLERSLLVFLVACFALTLARTMWVESDLWDSWWMWAYKARILFHHGGVPLDLFEVYGATTPGHWDYPLHVPLMQAFVLDWLGDWNDQPTRILQPLFYAALCVHVACFVGRVATPLRGLLAAGALASLVALQDWTIGTLTEPILLYYGLGSLLLLLRWMDDSRRETLLLSALFAGLAAWTKNEGLALLLGNALCLGLFGFVDRDRPRREAARSLLLYGVVAVAVIAPWKLYAASAGLSNDVVNTGALSASYLAERAHRLLELPRLFLHHFADWRSWNLLWPLLGGALVVYGRRGFAMRERILLLAMVVQLAVYAGLYWIWPYRESEFVNDTLQRLMLFPAGVAVVMVALAGSRAGADAPVRSRAPR